MHVRTTQKLMVRRLLVTSCLATLLVVPAGSIWGQTQIRPGFNLFSVEQDEEIGRASSAEAERQLPLLDDRSIEAYVNAIGARLAAVAPGARYPYHFKVVNASDINAFALPGGFLYLNRGLIEAAGSEGQLAGVMSHEMAHVALRHGTSQASKAYVGQEGLGLLGGLISNESRSTERVITEVGGFGMNMLFLKFSRTGEEQADITGAQMLARAGYDPKDMVEFFDMLADKQNRDPGKVEQFFSSHPHSSDRAARITREMTMLTITPIRPVGGFTKIRADLLAMRPAASMQDISQAQPAGRGTLASSTGDRAIGEHGIELPSEDFLIFAQRSGLFQIGYPDNWRVHEASWGQGVTFAPDGGFMDTGGVERDLVYGVILNHYDPFNEEINDRFGDSGGPFGNRTSLARATNDILGQILVTNPTLAVLQESERSGRIDGQPSLSVVLSGRSRTTLQEERVTVFTRELADDHIIYALFIAPGKSYVGLSKTFNRMMSSLQVGEGATHLSSSTDSMGSAFEERRGLTVPAGTVLSVEFQQTLSSASSLVGDDFTARVVEPVLVGGRIAIATGSIVSGRVMSVQPSKKFGGRARIDLEFLRLRPAAGTDTPMAASFHGKARSQTGKDAGTIGGAAAGGAVLGRILGNDSKDTLLGALVGGAIGTGIAAGNKGQEVMLPAGMVVDIQLDSPFSM